MKARFTPKLKVAGRIKLPQGHSRYAPKLPDIHDFPVIKPARAHMLNTKKYYPSGPQLHQTRLKYPYLSAETLAEEISHQALTQKTPTILKELSQALGNVSTGKLARPVTGMVVKISGVTHVEKVRRPRRAFAPPDLEQPLTLYRTALPGRRASRRSSASTAGRCRAARASSSCARATATSACARPTSSSSRPPSRSEQAGCGPQRRRRRRLRPCRTGWAKAAARRRSARTDARARNNRRMDP